MGAPERVGLFLRNEAELELVRSAVVECGLDPVELNAAQFRARVQTGFGAGDDALLLTGGPLQWIITDSALSENDPTVAKVSLITRQRPLIGLVCDENAHSDFPEQDSAFAFVLLRPLRADAVRMQLRQVVRVSSVYAERNQRMLDDLDLARSIFNSVSNGITICDVALPDLPLVFVNPAFEKMTGYTADEVSGLNCRLLQGNDSDQPGLNVIREAIRDQRSAHALLKNYRKDGTPFWNELYLSPIFNSQGVLTHFAGFQNDVTALVESTQRLDHLAHHDALTGLANRGLLMEQLGQTLPRAKRSGTKIAVLFLDLDNFKNVNDVFGHDAGDMVLKATATRLKSSTRAEETVARLGGDEFIVVLEDISDARPLELAIQRLVRTLSEPVTIFDQEIRPSVSVGASIFPIDGETSEALIRVADFKMYTAKHETRSGRQSLDENAGSRQER